MKKFLLTQVFLGCLLVLGVASARADEEQTQIDILHSDAGVSQKWTACQKLRVIGTAKAVPEVAALLTDEKLSQAARQTLDGLPYPEVDDALREALGKTTGLLKVGIVDTIGWRRKPEAVAFLVPLLAEADNNVAAATAGALGRIGGQQAIAALSTARDQGAANVQIAVQVGLLECAERLMARHDEEGAAAIYRGLYNDKSPMGIRGAAWRGLVLSDPSRQAKMMEQALGGSDHAIEQVALKVLRESGDRHLVEACASQWGSLSAEAQLAVIDAEGKLGEEALPMLRTASQSANPVIRVAAWTALGELNDLASIPALAHTAASSTGNESEAARASLACLRGAGASEALLAAVNHAATPEKTELLRALGVRQDASAAKVLLKNASDGDEAVRLVALQSLTEIAPAEALSPLLKIARDGGSDELRGAALEALSVICRASADKGAATLTVVKAENHLPAAEKGAFLPLLAQLATPDALAAVLEASRSSEVALAKKAVRVLAQWPNATPAPALLEMAHSASDNTLRTLALRGAISLANMEPDASKRLALLEQALTAANRPDEKTQALGQLGQIPTPEALNLVLKAMTDPDIAGEASFAALDIAEKLPHAQRALAREAAGKVLEVDKTGDLFQRAWALRGKPGKQVPFIRDWVVCGPYTRSDLTGAKAYFDVPFGPEISGRHIEWKEVPAGDQINLLSLFPDGENCAAYLRTTMIAPEDCLGVLLMGSDDGIKAWLNGAVVHANNTDRGMVADQDVALIHLKKGSNELIFKITQGGAGWGACARIASPDGSPIAGLEIQTPTGAAGALKAE